MTEPVVSVPELLPNGIVRPSVADAVKQWNDALATTLLLFDAHDDLTEPEVEALFDVPLVAAAVIYAMALSADDEMEEIVGRFAAALAGQRVKLADAKAAPGAQMQ